MTDASQKNPDSARHDRQERRIQIARATRELIVERGFEGLRTRDIAERVGINIATLHYHVPSKAALIELLAESMRDEFIQRHLAHPRAALGALEQLRLEFADFRADELEAPQLHRVMNELFERSRRDDTIAAVIRPMQEYWHGQITEILEIGRDDGSFRADLDPPAAATMMIGAMINARRRDNDIGFFDKVTAELERSFVNRTSQGKQS